MKPSDLSWENYVVVQFVQASLGLIGPHVRAIALNATPNEVTLYFALSDCTAEDKEDVEEILLDLDVLLDGKSIIRSELHVESDGHEWPGRDHRRVYVAKQASSGLPAGTVASDGGGNKRLGIEEQA